MTEPITTFQGEYRFLSNFWFVQIVGRDGWLFPSVEHAFQAEKTDDMEQFHAIRQAATVSQAKRLGRTVTLRSTWEAEKITVMYRLLLQKFLDPALRVRLLATDDRPLVEGNYWNDTFWGVCNGIGENHLGRLLMQIRQEIRNGR